jgi:hypothetical protein
MEHFDQHVPDQFEHANDKVCKVSRLTVILTHVSDPLLSATLANIRETAGDNASVTVVDDLSPTNIEATCPNLNLANKVIVNRHRLGVGPSRHIGVESARSAFVMVADSHMLFPVGWLPKAIARLEAHPKTIFCTTCVGLDKTHMRLDSPASFYYGAHMNWSGADPNDRTKKQVCEAVWNKQAPADNAEIGAVMGGAYLCHRDWFLKLSALRFLRVWGMDEPMLSLASWLCGGDCRLITEFGIGHVFGIKGQRPTWSCPMGPPTYNKFLFMHTMLPEKYASQLRDELKAITDPREWIVAEEMAKRDFHIFETERLRFKSMFTREFSEYKERFP